MKQHVNCLEEEMSDISNILRNVTDMWHLQYTDLLQIFLWQIQHWDFLYISMLIFGLEMSPFFPVQEVQILHGN